jgi:hypothetical protein
VSGDDRELLALVALERGCHHRRREGQQWGQNEC